MRIAHGAIIQESNTFSPVPCSLEKFKDSYLYYGEEVFQLADTGTETAGVISVMEAAGMKILPTVAAHAVSYGPLSKACYHHLRGEFLSRLKGHGAIDGLVFNLHGSMVAKGELDPEGDLLTAAREVVGPDIPIVATFDLHAHITERIIDNSDALIGYGHYPHDDVHETGQRAARLLLRILREEIKPVMAMVKAPMMTPPNNSLTAVGPMSLIRAEARDIENLNKALAISYFPVHPWNDLPDMGMTLVAVTDNDLRGAREMAHQLAVLAWELKNEFEVETWPPEKAIRRALAIEGGPVVLCDTADSPGGGATGDGTAVLEALLKSNVKERTILSLVDPGAVQRAIPAGLGNQLTITLGNKAASKEQRNPIGVTGTVSLVSDGRFVYSAGLLRGVTGHMGLSVVLEVGSISILLTSNSTYEWADDQYRSVGLDPRMVKLVVVKMPVNFKMSYQGVMKAYFILDTPGPCSANLRAYDYKLIPRPTYPFDLIEQPVYRMYPTL
jgi:microcystin degradation protein MlrC